MAIRLIPLILSVSLILVEAWVPWSPPANPVKIQAAPNSPREIQLSQSRERELTDEERAFMPAKPDLGPPLRVLPVPTPAKFNAATEKAWERCWPIFETIGNQGPCGSCYAFSSSATIADRHCISSPNDPPVKVSASQAAGCADLNLSPAARCAGGSHETAVFAYASVVGLPSGAPFSKDPKEGCLPFPLDPALDYSLDVNKPLAQLTCASECSNLAFKKGPDAKKSYEADLIKIASYWSIQSVLDGAKMTKAELSARVRLMQEEIYAYGSITTTITAYPDFAAWTPDTGIYKGKKPADRTRDEIKRMVKHSVRIIGWDTSGGEQDSYWIVANSWGPGWGHHGFFFIQLGLNTEAVESAVSAPIMTLPLDHKCDNKLFATGTPIDDIVWINVLDYEKDRTLEKVIYMFQGKCAVRIAVDPVGNKINAIGEAAPILSIFAGAPFGNVTGHYIENGEMWMEATDATVDFSCKPSVAGRYTCKTKPYLQTATAPNYVPPRSRNAITHYFAGSELRQWKYMNDYSMKFQNGMYGTAPLLKSTATQYAAGPVFWPFMSGVTAFLDIDGARMFAFGKSKTSPPTSVGGIVTYPKTVEKDYDNFNWHNGDSPAAVKDKLSMYFGTGFV